MSETVLSGIDLPEIVLPHIGLPETEYAGVTPALLVVTQLVAEFEGHDSHGLSHLFGHFDSVVSVMYVHLYQVLHQATGS